MGRRNQEADAVIAELNDYGIAGELRNTGGGHIEIFWSAKGRKRQLFVASTASDWRAVYNVRARVRRFLREDGVQKVAPAANGTLAKALSVPPPVTLETSLERLTYLETSVDSLLDIICDLQDSHDKLAKKLANLKVTVSFGDEVVTPKPLDEVLAPGENIGSVEPSPVEDTPKQPVAAKATKKISRKGDKQKLILAFLNFHEWKHLNHVAVAAGYDITGGTQAKGYKACSVMLYNLRKAGVIKSDNRGFYQRVALAKSAADDAPKAPPATGDEIVVEEMDFAPLEA